jgi:hypothetical protein
MSKSSDKLLRNNVKIGLLMEGSNQPRMGSRNELEVAVLDKMSSPSKPKRGQANRRERVRTENVNAGFERLRKLIPTEPENRKLSKIEILRLSTSYIKHLYNLTKAK